jgi:hypothetical protein
MKAFRKTIGSKECYGILAKLDAVGNSHRPGKGRAFNEGSSDDLRKSAPAISNESLADLRKSINKQFDELTKVVTELVKKRMTETAAEKRFKPLAHGEVAKCLVDGIPARKELGHNPARNANIRKSADAFGHDLQEQGKSRFVPAGMRKNFDEAEATELLKTARANGQTVR